GPPLLTDVNRDGRPDLVVGSGEQAIVLLNEPGGFRALPPIPVGFRVLSQAAADLDGDGAVDLVLAGVSGGAVVLGDGTGAFTLAQNFPLPRDFSLSLAIGDVNGDKLPDIAINGTTAGVSVLLGNGDGSFLFPPPERLSSNGTGLSSADVNRDGQPDLV